MASPQVPHGPRSPRDPAGRHPLVLGSGSPRRRAMLERAGVHFVVDPPGDVDERWHGREHPVNYVRRLALEKAMAVATRQDRASPVLGADTTVWLDPLRGPLGKPAHVGEARAILQELFRAGRHTVTTAFALLRAGEASPQAHVQHVTAEVWMRRPTDSEMERYLARNDWADKAGGYGIQSDAEGWVLEVQGSYSAVVGLPLAHVLQALAQFAPEVLA